MGLRFRRSIKIAPGVRWNLGLKGSSFSFGPRGAKLTLGNRGTRVTTGIPGTGLSYTTTLPSGSGQAIQAAHLIQTPEIPWDETLIDRMGVDRTQDVAKRRLGTISGFVFFAGVGGCLAQQVGVGSVVALGGLIGLMVAGAKPTAAQLAIRERDHRIQVLRETTGQDGHGLPSMRGQRSERNCSSCLPSSRSSTE